MHIAILGGASFLGERLIPLLRESGFQVTAFTRDRSRLSSFPAAWRHIDDWSSLEFDAVVSLAPIWAFPEYLECLAQSKVKRIVALSSTSRYTKCESPDLAERVLAERLAASETLLARWAEERGVEWVVLRPTMIYGLGRDKNVFEVARFIRRFGFFPLAGGGTGLRQPIHADDVVQICLRALTAPAVVAGGYNLSGGEVLSYRAMVIRIFEAQRLPVRVVSIPVVFLNLIISVARCLPRYRHLSAAMASRMAEDLVFDHCAAQRQFDFLPRPFELGEADLP
ncbi:NAD(P)-dependent oxidoreductase [Pseudomonas gingeri]|uniref:NAD-dependent epimerase/dehydratase family protein n=1 Tax=Pseudomonas gingeri TaxID=117681 RepID=UPI0015A47B69|nr:NAD(P)-dependent oxidoreductase [Pseudomonas gingeri]NWA26168.1 NAD(P)-dependent oxidoreductase [Pseudomonas gingeri]